MFIEGQIASVLAQANHRANLKDFFTEIAVEKEGNAVEVSSRAFDKQGKLLPLYCVEVPQRLGKRKLPWKKTILRGAIDFKFDIDILGDYLEIALAYSKTDFQVELLEHRLRQSFPDPRHMFFTFYQSGRILSLR